MTPFDETHPHYHAAIRRVWLLLMSTGRSVPVEDIEIIVWTDPNEATFRRKSTGETGLLLVDPVKFPRPPLKED